MRQLVRDILNRVMRLGYRAAYLGLRGWWYLRRPQTYGAAVALWHDGQVLLVRTSYRDCYSLPGGFIRKGEPARQAACRELAEELGIDMPAQTLQHAWCGTLEFESRRDTMDIWEASLDCRPAVRVGGREITWAGWMKPSAALGRRLLPHVAVYLAQH